MPKKVNEISAVEIRQMTKPGRYAVGGVAGLLLAVKPSGARSWILRTMVGGKRRNIGLGGFPDVGLSQAREKAREVKVKIEAGEDPVEEKQARRSKVVVEQAKLRLSFEDAARLCHEKKSSEFRNAKHAKDWISAIDRHAIPVMGAVPVSKIELAHVLKVLEPIWSTKTETATRVRQRMEAVLTWATVSGYRQGENPARWKGHLDAILPKPNKIRKVNHFTALPWREIGEFMADLGVRDGTAARCLEFIILTACRSGEARFAVWSEIDLEAQTWIIPAERMKTGREHRVPLSHDAVRLLQRLPRFDGVDYVFAAPRGGASFRYVH